MIEADLGAKAFFLIIGMGALSGAISFWVFRRWTDTAKLRLAINRIMAHLFEFQLFGDEPALVLRAQKDLLAANVRMLKIVAVPSLLLLAPFALLLAATDAMFGHVPLRLGDAAVVTVQTTGNEREMPPVRLLVPDGMRVETPPVRVPASSQISWRIRPVSRSAGKLTLQTGGRTVEKSISARPGLQWISEGRGNSLRGLFTHPLELPFADPVIDLISVTYPPATVLRVNWIVWFLIASLVGAGLAATIGVPSRRGFLLLIVAASSFVSAARAETVSPLLARGYTVIPEPQRVTLRAGDFPIGSEWRLQLGHGLNARSVAVESLEEELLSRHQLELKGVPSSIHVVQLEIIPGSVKPGPAQDADTAALAAQSYRMQLSPRGVRITANAEPGLFYGVETFTQLLKRRGGSLWLPEGEIVDWPDLQMRQIYWDDAHHLEPLAELKRAVRQAAFFKINGFVIKLEGHFEYRSAPALIEPQALSPADFQKLTDYGLRYNVQVIPYLDAPAHIAFILKHPEYASLRAFPNSNYEMCTTNPDSLKLLYGMYDDLLAANRGVKYFYLSTDEAYYVGMADQPGCREASRKAELGSPGKVLAEFVSKAANYLHERGRTVVFWGEYPLKPDDLQALPAHLINGETYGNTFDPVYKARGIRQMIYGSTEGEEHLFPHYFLRSEDQRIHPLYEAFERVGDGLSKIASEPARRSANLMGLIIAGWGDMGLHPETFWLGYATITAAGWKPPTGDVHESMSSFYPLFYGDSVMNMDRAYQLMSSQAQIWTDSWESVDSTARTPIWGNSYEVFTPPKPAHDQTVPIPAPPEGPDLRYPALWREQNAQRLRMTSEAMAENDELRGLLNRNLQLAQFNRYGLEVFVAIARLCRHNLDLLVGLRRIDEQLILAGKESQQGAPQKAVEALDRALAEVRGIKQDRNAVLRDATSTWYQSWLPRVPAANGRKFLHEVDDVKDHLPDRTVDMRYLVYRELLLPFDDWYQQTESARNRYAESHKLPPQTTNLAWKALQ